MRGNNGTRRQRTPLVLAVAALMVAALVAMTGCVKVVKIGEEAKLTGETTFDASSSVEEMWDSKLLPEITGEATDLVTLLKESGDDPATAKEQYGLGNGKKVFAVKGTGTVTAVDSAKQGTMTVQLEGYTGAAEVKIQVGPIYKGTSIRDALSFVSNQDVKNQVEWAELSQKINEKVNSDVVSKVDVASATGKKVTFTGCFTSDGSKVLITPVELSVE